MKIKYSYIILIIFALTTILYLNINKVPLTHPGNLKAADSFYHALITEGIIETEQWNYYSRVFSLGTEKATNSQPPLQYINAAILTRFTGVPAWVTFYLIVCLSQAFIILLVYLISNEIFNKKVAALAAAMCILPLTIKAWLYTLYIGIWIQIGAYFFIVAYLWLFIKYLKKQENWILVFLGVCISSVMLIHPPDITMLFVPTLFIGYKILMEKKFKIILKRGLLFGLIPFIILLVLLPRFIFVWGAQGGGGYKLGFYGLSNTVFFSRSYTGGLVFPDMFFIPILLLPIILFGFIQLSLNYKKYKLWIAITLYYLALTYLSPFFFQGPYFFGRARSLTPFILFPTMAYLLYSIIKAIKLSKQLELAILAIVGALFIIFSIPEYIGIVNQMQYEHISKGEWDAYTWIHQNTPIDAKILFFGGVFQNELIYTKRISAEVPREEFQKIVQEVISTNVTPTSFIGYYGGNSVRAVHKYEITPWQYGTWEEPSTNLSLFDFDYVLFQHLNQDIANINQYFATQYINNYGFIPVYNQGGYLIIKNG
jgi:hypothetical protein